MTTQTKPEAGKYPPQIPIRFLTDHWLGQQFYPKGTRCDLFSRGAINLLVQQNIVERIEKTKRANRS